MKYDLHFIDWLQILDSCDTISCRERFLNNINPIISQYAPTQKPNSSKKRSIQMNKDALSNALVRPHLEYCVSIWQPLLKKDKELIENVLHCASKLIPGISNFSYADCLCVIDLLKYCWTSGDIIQVYKILHGVVNTVSVYTFKTNLDKIWSDKKQEF